MAHEGNSKQHARSLWPAAEATAGGRMDLDGLSAAAGAAASPGAAMYGPAAEALLEGAEYVAETKDVMGSSDAAAAAGVRPPRLVDLGAEDRAEYGAEAEDGHWERGGGFGGDEAEATAAGGAVEDGPGAAAMAEACGARPPVKPSDCPTMTKRQRKLVRAGRRAIGQRERRDG